MNLPEHRLLSRRLQNPDDKARRPQRFDVHEDIPSHDDAALHEDSG